MSTTTLESRRATILRALARSKNARQSAGDLRKKLGLGAGPDPETDRALAGLIDDGLITAARGAKEGPHPRPNAAYRLTDQGRQHLRPARPDFPEEQLRTQEAFLLLQVFRARGQTLTRSDLNGKLKTKAAVGQLEFDVKGSPETVDYHLAALVEQGALVEERRGVSVSYALSPGQGATALAAATQHDAVSFTMNGQTLNALLAAARGAAPAEEAIEAVATAEAEPEAAPQVRSADPEDIARYVELLQADRYAGKDLVPIHAVRNLVAKHLGAEAAGHPTFDPLIKRMRSDGLLEVIAISDNRDATQQELDDSVPGMNETLFYIVTR